MNAIRQESQDSTSIEARVLFALFLAVLFWFLVVGVGPVHLISALFVYFSVCHLGFASLGKIAPVLTSTPQRWTLFFGPCLGVGLLQIFLVRAVTSELVFKALLIVCTTLMISATIQRMRHVNLWGFLRAKTKALNLEDARNFLLSVAILGLILHSEWWWNAPIIVAALLGALLANVGGILDFRRLRFLILVVSLVSSVLIAQWLRVDIWWISGSSDDGPYFVALSNSLVENGPIVDTFADAVHGPRAMSYHHLAYLFVGLVDLVAGGDEFLALTRVAPILITVSALSSLILFLKNFSRTSLNPERHFMNWLLTAGLFFSLIRVAQPLSDLLATSVLLGIAGVSASTLKIDGHLRYVLVVSVLLGALTFSKVFYIYGGVLALATIALVHPGLRLRSLAPVVVGSGLVALLSSSSIRTAQFGFSAFHPLMFGEYATGGNLHRVIALLFLLLPFVLPLTAVALNMTQNPRPKLWNLGEKEGIRIGLLATVLAGMSLRLFIAPPLSRVGEYLIMPALIAGALLLSDLAIRCFEAASVPARRFSQRNRAILIASGAVLVWGFLMPNLIPEVNSGSLSAKSIRLAQIPQFSGVVLVIVLIASFVVHKTQHRRDRQTGSLLRIHDSFVIPILSLGLASGLVIHAQRFEEQLHDFQSGEMAAINTGVIGSENVKDMGVFIESHTSEDSLIAYSLCNPAKESNLSRTNCQKPMPLAAYSKRRFLHLGAFSDDWGFANEEERADFKLSHSLLQFPGEHSVKALKGRGVNYVVIDTDRVNAVWLASAAEAGAIMLYSNKEMALLSI